MGDGRSRRAPARGGGAGGGAVRQGALLPGSVRRRRRRSLLGGCAPPLYKHGPRPATAPSCRREEEAAAPAPARRQVSADRPRRPSPPPAHPLSRGCSAGRRRPIPAPHRPRRRLQGLAGVPPPGIRSPLRLSVQPAGSRLPRRSAAAGGRDTGKKRWEVGGGSCVGGGEGGCWEGGRSVGCSSPLPAVKAPRPAGETAKRAQLIKVDDMCYQISSAKSFEDADKRTG